MATYSTNKQNYKIFQNPIIKYHIACTFQDIELKFKPDDSGSPYPAVAA